MLTVSIDLKIVRVSVKARRGGKDMLVCLERRKLLTPPRVCELKEFRNKYILLDSKYSQEIASIQLEQGGGGNFQEKRLGI